MRKTITFLIALLLAGVTAFGFSGSGSGTLGDPWQVTSAAQLNEVRDGLTNYYKQMNDIDLSSSYPNWSPIGTSATIYFSGDYDGNGYKITGLSITSGTYNGLFGYFGSNGSGSIHDLGVTGSITDGTYIGMLAGRCSGTVTNCYSTGTISSSNGLQIGGLVGQVYYGGTLSNSYSSVNCSSSKSSTSSYVGGLTGFITASSSYGSAIQNCYSTGSATQSSTGYPGGFIGGIGNSYASITNSYSTGAVSGSNKGGFVGKYTAGTISNCFFDSETAGTSTICGLGSPTGITAKTTTEMQTPSTFTDAGWSTSDWRFASGSYPQLLWQIPASSTFTGSGNWSTAGNWSNGLPSNTTNVIIDGTCTVDDNASIDDLTVNAGGSLTISSGITLAVGGNLTLESGASSTASLINSGTLNVTGTTTVQRYMGGSAWHLISSPVSGQTVASFLAANSLVDTKPETNIRAMKNYLEATDTWSELFTNSTSGDLVGGNGYAVWPNADGTVSFSGSLQTTTVDVAVARTPDTGFGWNLVGNPFPSAIAINTAAGADNFIALNSSVLNQSYCGIYYWSGSAYVAVNLSNAAFYAQVGQGFFVKSVVGEGTVSFTPAMQSHQPSAEFKSAEIPWPEIKLTASLEDLGNSAVIRFNDAMNQGLDVGYDAGVFKSGFDVYTRLVEDNGVDFGIQCLPLEANSEMVVPIGLESNTQGTVSLSVDINNLPSGCQVTLEDRETGMLTPITQSGQVASLQVAANSKVTDRFYLHTSYSTTGVTTLPESWKVYIANGQICISGSVTDNATAAIYDVLGRKIGDYQLQKGSLNYIPCPDFRNGVYLVSIRQQRGTFTKKISVIN